MKTPALFSDVSEQPVFNRLQRTSQRPPFIERSLQSGFTLIELMVVVAIMAILMSAVGLSLQPNEAKRLQVTAEKSEGYLQLACDQAAMRHQLVWVNVTEKGLKAYALTPQAQNPWQSLGLKVPAKALQPIMDVFEWPENIHVTWQLPERPELNLALEESVELEAATGEKANALKSLQNGWRCWPSGEMEAGEIGFQNATETPRSQTSPSAEVRLKWDDWGRFQIIDPSPESH